jgi:hypothetical protein
VKWRTTFGKISIEEKLFTEEGKLFRPFCKSARVKSLGYSLALQRAISDFGADGSFSSVVAKMKEHYGIEVPSSTVRLITEKHGHKMGAFKVKKEAVKEEIIISETDGSMVPIVEIQEREGDLRKARKTCWKEVKLSFARGKDKVNRIYGGLIGTAEQAGEKMVECAILAGMKEGTYVHAVGDGAPWIAEQFKLRFCNRGSYLIDFYHLCEYLSQAAIWCSVFEKEKWLEESKAKLKTGRQKEVFEEIKKRIEDLQIQDLESGLIKCYRYMENRLDYMNYKKALEKGLPIGSGEIESSHRHVIQKRLKIAGAWWKEENANAMINLRIGRLNNCWEDYWQLQKLAA